MNLKDCYNVEDFRKLAKKKLPSPIFHYIDGGSDDEVTLKRNPSENMQIYLDAYYLTPLMVRSIFENSIQYLISVKEFEIALELIQKLKSIKPEYDFRKIFSNYENEINKLKLASAN